MPTARGTCSNSEPFLIASGIINTILDFAVSSLFWIIVHRLGLPSDQRPIIMLLLSAGLLTCGAGIVRVIILDAAVRKLVDLSWNSYPVWMMGIIEVDVGNICAVRSSEEVNVCVVCWVKGDSMYFD